MIPLIVLLLFASLSSIESLDHSCKDIHAFNQKSRNDTYWIQNRNNQFYKVFCEFHDTFGYTYISRNTTVEINIDDLLSTKKHVKIRKVQDDGSQIETVLRNIEQYKNLSLGIFYNNHTGYAQPRIYSKILAPYLYVGFLPKEIANNNNTQGYRAGNEDKTFTNCDKNPNSYFVLYFNPNQELIETSKYNDFLQFWIISGSKAVHNMPSEFYFDYEIHFGGCGGFIFRHQKENKDGISIGLKFDFLTSCLSSPCYNEGSCRAISDTDFTCDCKYGYTGELCDILTQDPMCNLGIVHRHNASLSSVYVYYLPDEVTVTSKLLAEKALDSKYYRHKWDCAGSLDKQPDRDAWWQVTFSSPSMIYKMNFVFREKLSRHAGYYVFITNRTVRASELTSLEPVYHDEEANVSHQNTIIFPEGRSGVQVFLYVNKSEPGTEFVMIEPCEVEIYGCIEDDGDKCACSNETIFGPWSTNVVFNTGSLALTCNSKYLSIRNLSEFEDSQFVSILKKCDGKSQCAIKTSHIQHKSINFYCQDKCESENITNAVLKHHMVDDLALQYHYDGRVNFTAFLKSRVYDCLEGHVLTRGNLTLECQKEGQWFGDPPVCNVTCRDPIHENSTTLRETSSFPFYFEGYNVTYTCKRHHRHSGGDLTRFCNGSGNWTGEKPVCKRCKCPCNRVRSQNFIKDPVILKNRIKKLKKELKVKMENLSSTLRSKTCAKDDRQSSTGIGSILGGGIITFVVVLLVISDLPLLYRQIRHGP